MKTAVTTVLSPLPSVVVYTKVVGPTTPFVEVVSPTMGPIMFNS